MLLTTDGLITINSKKVILIKRANPPFMDKLVMPGGHVDETDLSVASACARELSEEIGLTVDSKKLKLLMVLDDPHRDPRSDRRISIVYHLDLPSLPKLKAATDAKEVIVREIKFLTPDEIGFDHWQAIKIIKK